MDAAELLGHSLRGLCGLKSVTNVNQQAQTSHSLRGLCGLKLIVLSTVHQPHPSQPARAVWIEIPLPRPGWFHSGSQPARAVWIEMPKASLRVVIGFVTACEGCVD